MTATLAGLRIAVTGGASGIGRATVEQLVTEGAAAAILDIAGLEEAESRHSGPVLRCDVSDESDARTAFAEVAERLGGLDGVVAAAGIGGEANDCVETSAAAWQRVIDVNLTGVFLTVRAAVPFLRRAGGGSVVLLASQFGLVGTRESPAYCAAKGGVVNLARALALDHAGEGIRVNTVCPGPVDTAMFASSRGADDPDLVRRMLPVGRIGTAAEIARTILFLLSPDVGYLTGSTIAVDGGWTAR